MKKRIRRKLHKAEFAPTKRPTTIKLMVGDKVISSTPGTMLEYPKRKPKSRRDTMPMSWSANFTVAAR
jgi:hypothetical protein